MSLKTSTGSIFFAAVSQTDLLGWEKTKKVYAGSGCWLYFRIFQAVLFSVNGKVSKLDFYFAFQF